MKKPIKKGDTFTFTIDHIKKAVREAIIDGGYYKSDGTFENNNYCNERTMVELDEEDVDYISDFIIENLTYNQ